jgi:transposase-like protein
MMSASGKRKWSASEKLRIVLEVMNPAVSVADLCRREGVTPFLFKPQRLPPIQPDRIDFG